jgi:hypothetical protein
LSFGVSEPLQRCGIDTQGRLANNFRFARHAGEAVVPLAQNYALALRIGVEDPGCLGDIRRAIARAILTCIESSLLNDER